jgi:uncharacterized protein
VSEPTSDNSARQVNRLPFARLRGRGLLGRLLLACIASGLLVSLLWPAWGSGKPLPLPTVMFGLLWYSILLLLLARGLARARLAPHVLLGSRPTWGTLGRYALLAIPLVVVSIACTFLLYLPLSYLLPGFVEQWVLAPDMLWTQGPHYVLANGLSFLSFVVVAPIVEEFFFRGLLLTRWSLKWGTTRGILASAAVFALLHPDIIGKFFFGYVMSVLYLQTRSLYIPMSVHIANNGIAWLLEGIEILRRAPNSPPPLAEFQSGWWVGVLAAGLITPWVIKFTKRHMPTGGWGIPYFAPQGNVSDARRDER